MDNVRAVHLVHSEREGLWAVQSPHIPELRLPFDVLDRPVRFDDVADLAAELGHSFDITFWHEEHHVIDNDGDHYVVRWQILDFDTKYVITHRLSQALAESRFTADDKALQPQRPDGSRLLLIVEPHDTIGWVNHQLEANGCATLCSYSGSGELLLMPWGQHPVMQLDVRLIAKGWGFGADNTVGGLELFLHAYGLGHFVRSILVPRPNQAWNSWKTCIFVPRGYSDEVTAALKHR